MNVIFLDYDGVINTPIWNAEGTRCSVCYPQDNRVNNFRSVQLVSEFCLKYHYGIVVSSSWRIERNYRECLTNSGLWEGIEILGKTPYLPGEPRTTEIKQYLSAHPEVDNFLIFDDEGDMADLGDHWIQCDPNRGFGAEEFKAAEQLCIRMEHSKSYTE